MGILNDETITTATGVASGNQTNPVAVNTSDNADNVTCFIRESGGGDPGDITVVAERYSESEDVWVEFGRNSLTSTGNERSVTDEAVPSKMRYTIINDTASGQDYDISVVSY